VDIIELIKAIVIGVIEGITEWLPISSTGHMILADEFIKLDVSPQFWELFLVVIQLGAIMAVIVLYFGRLNPLSPKKTPAQRRSTLRLWAKVIVGCLPAAVIGILFDDWVEEHFFNALTVTIALVVYGIAFIVVERIKEGRQPIGAHSPGASVPAQDSLVRSPLDVDSYKTRQSRPETGSRASEPLDARSPETDLAGDVARVDGISFGRALGIGAFQCLAIIPGTSRSGSTILGGRILGVSRSAAAEFSFFLAIPVMFGWSLLKVLKAFVLDSLALSSTEIGVLVAGILVAFVVSIVAIRFLMGFIKNHSFEAFGWYRIVLGVAVLAYFILTGQLFA
jgi:undecaprenyl-diphosphatase